MVVGVLEMRLLLHDAQTLKDKRRIVKGLRDRLRNAFNVSVSEVEELDKWQTAVLGVAIATNERAFADQVLAKVVDHVRRSPEAVLVRYETEIL